MAVHTLKLLGTLTESLVIKGWLGSEVVTDGTYKVTSTADTKTDQDEDEFESEHNFTIDQITISAGSLHIQKTDGKNLRPVTVEQAFEGVQIAYSTKRTPNWMHEYATIFELTSISHDTMGFNLRRTVGIYGETSTYSNLQYTATRQP